MAASGSEYGAFSAVDTYSYGQAYGGSAFAPGGAPAAPAAYGFGAPAFGAAPGYPGMDAPSPLDAEIQIVLREIHGEIQALEQSGEYGEQFKNAKRLLSTEAQKLENNVDPEWLEVDISKPIKVTKKVLVPSFRHPKFNFVGKVLGPKGTTLQNIAKTYKCHVYILGRGSTRDRQKEQELLGSGDPQYAHYGGPLHVKIETTAPPAIAYQRVSGVLNVLSELLQPVKDTHIEGITTEPNPILPGEGGEGGDDELQDSNGNDGNVGNMNANHDQQAPVQPPMGGGPMRGNFFPRARGGFNPRGRGGFAPRGGFGAGRGGGRGGTPNRGGPRGGRGGGYQPY